MLEASTMRPAKDRSAIARRSTAVPRSLWDAYASMSRMSAPSPTIAAWCTTASTPVTAARATSGSRRSPRTTPAGSSGAEPCAAGSRASTPRTSCPAPASESTTCEPMKPAAPVTRTSTRRGYGSERAESEPGREVSRSVVAVAAAVRDGHERGRRRPPRARRARGAAVGARAHARGPSRDRRRQRLDRRLGRRGAHPRGARGGGAAARLRRCLLRGAAGGHGGGRVLLGLRRLAGPARAAGRLPAGDRRRRGPRGRGPAGASRCLAFPRPAGQPRARGRAAPPRRGHADRSRADARGPARRAARPAHRGPPLGVAAGDGAPRGLRRVADRRGRSELRAAGRAVEGDRDGQRHRARGARHGSGARLTATLAVIAKVPAAGRVKTRLCPPCTPLEAARLAEASLRDVLDAMLATPAERRAVVLEGCAPAWLPPQLDVVSQRGDGLDERLAHAFADLGRALVISMDTPQVRPADLLAGLRALCRLDALGLRRAELRVLRDVDTWADALGAAAEAPRTRFAAAVSATGLAFGVQRLEHAVGAAGHEDAPG